MADQTPEILTQVLNDVTYFLETTFKFFGITWERYEDDFEDLLGAHKGRVEKYSVAHISREIGGETLANALKNSLEHFVESSVLDKFSACGDSERVLVLTLQLFSYLRKSSDWFKDSFSDFDTAPWPFRENCSYCEGCRGILYDSVYSSLRANIRDNYMKVWYDIRRKYAYCHKDAAHHFNEQRSAPLFAIIAEWERENALSYWWEPIFADYNKLVPNKLNTLPNSASESLFINFASNYVKSELLMVQSVPDDKEKSNYNKVKKMLEEMVCDAYWERSNGFSFLGILTDNSFDSFLFKNLLEIHMRSPRHEDIFMMHFRSKVRMDLEFKALTLVDAAPNKRLTLEELKPLLTKLEDTKTALRQRLAPFFHDYPGLRIFEKELSKSIRERLDIYQIGYELIRTEGVISNLLRQPCELNSAFSVEAKFIALFFKHLANRKDLMNDLELFADINIEEGRHNDVKTLAAFVSRHRSVCSRELYDILDQANLIEK